MAQVPSCFNRANGDDLIPPANVPMGTPAPEGSVLITDASGTNIISFNEDDNSPEIERAEQATITHTFTTTWQDAINRLIGLGRGTILYDSYGNETRVLSSKIVHMEGEAAKLIVVCEGLSFDTPPDEFDCVPVDLGINIIKHPRYFYYLDPNGTASDTAQERQAKQAIIAAVQTYQDAPFYPSQDFVNSLLKNNIQNFFAVNKVPVTTGTGATPSTTTFDASASPSVSLAIAAASEIITKLWKQIDNPPLTGYKITWKQYYFKDPAGGLEPLLYLNPGSYIEDPITEAIPSLPDYFGSTNGDYATGGTIFDQIANINPQCYRNIDGVLQISWARLPDEQDYVRTWFCVTRSWIGSPIGMWDQDLYSKLPRPTLPSQYEPLY